MNEQILKEQNAVVRHSLVERTEHWLIAISGLILLFSGFGEFPMYKRYMVTLIPGFSWAGDFWIQLKIHYIAAIVFTGAVVFHIAYHGLLRHRGLLPRRGDGKASLKTVLSFMGIGEEPPADKYLAEQRLAYAYIGVVSLILIITGIIKVIKNLPDVYLPPGLITGTTLIHTAATFFFLFGVIAHLAALALKVNRPLIKPMFTGRVHLDYVRHRHAIWYDELTKGLTPDALDIKEEQAESAGEALANTAADTPQTLVSEEAAGVPETPEKFDDDKPASS